MSIEYLNPEVATFLKFKDFILFVNYSEFEKGRLEATVLCTSDGCPTTVAKRVDVKTGKAILEKDFKFQDLCS